MRGRRWILVVTASLGPLLLALVWFETQQAKAVHPAGSQPVGQPTMVLRNHTERIRTRSGQVAWQFRAERVDVLDGGDYLIYKLEQGQYLTHDEPEVDFSADLAHFEARTQNIALKGNVRVASRRGLTFSCESMLWFEADGKLVVPQADQLTMSDPQRPTEEPAAVETRRLFLWPRQQEIELPDPLIARQKTQTMQAESAHGWLTDGRFELRGPATVALLTALPAATGAPGQLDKRLILGVGAGGVMVGNGRSGGTMMRGHVALSIPADRIDIKCQQAMYSGRETHRIRAQGELVLTDPANQLAAPAATVDTQARRAEFDGPVKLTHTGGGPGGNEPFMATAPRMTFWYTTGHRRAAASGPVRIDEGRLTGRGSRATVDLERQIAVLTGSVRLHQDPAQPAAPHASEVEQAKHQAVTLTCQRLDHHFAAPRSSLLTGNPRFYQADRQGTAHRITYDHDQQLVTMDGSVRMWNKKGERARCARLTYDVTRQETQLQTPARAEFWLRQGS